jgi:hypothetical protein
MYRTRIKIKTPPRGIQATCWRQHQQRHKKLIKVNMKCKIFGKIIGLLLFSFFFIRCGYFENDHTDFEKTILGNVKILKQESSDKFDLVFSESSETHAVIVTDCKSIFFNPIGKFIYVKEFISHDESNFYQIRVVNPLSKKITDGVRKIHITQKEFLNKTRGLSTQLQK